MHNQGQGEIASEKHRNMAFLKTECYLTINACTNCNMKHNKTCVMLPSW